MSKSNIHVVIVEDQMLFFEHMVSALDKKLGPCVIHHFKTEVDALDFLENTSRVEIDLVILDLIVPWTAPARSMKLPPTNYQGPYSAGLRCLRKIREIYGNSLPVLLFSVRNADIEDELDLETVENVHVVDKSADETSLQSILDELSL